MIYHAWFDTSVSPAVVHVEVIQPSPFQVLWSTQQSVPSTFQPPMRYSVYGAGYISVNMTTNSVNATGNAEVVVDYVKAAK